MTDIQLSRFTRIPNLGRVSPSNPRQAWKVGVWIYERERACLVEFLSTARSSLEAVELWRLIQPLLPNMRDPEHKAVLIASLGDHAAIITEAYQVLKQQGVKLTAVAWIYPGSNSRIAGLSNVLKRVLDKEQVETLPIPLVGCEDVDSQVECDKFLEKTLEQITTFSERQYTVHLSLAGGRKAMAAMMFLAAQKTQVTGLYHVLLNNSEVEQQLLRDTSYEALRSAPLNKQRQLLLMDYKKIEKIIDLINIPFLTSEAAQ